MFNVTVLKMKDIKKYVIVMSVTIVTIIIISQYFPMLIKWISKKSMIECLEQAVPSIASINEEYKKIAKEDEITEDKFLQGILKTQISSMKEIENIEVKEEAITKAEEEIPNEEKIEIVRKSDYQQK